MSDCLNVPLIALCLCTLNNFSDMCRDKLYRISEFDLRTDGNGAGSIVAHFKICPRICR